MGILRLGFVTIYLSEPLVNGFIAGASFQVLFGSQFPKMFGISVKAATGPLSIIHVSETLLLYVRLQTFLPVAMEEENRGSKAFRA